MTVWCGPVPKTCDTCETELLGVFYDAKTSLNGMWANMCTTCFSLGPGLGKLGTGWGQRYERQPDGSWLKTGG